MGFVSSMTIQQQCRLSYRARRFLALEKEMKLYKSISTGKIHLVLGGYTCNEALGKMTPNFEGTSDDITCKNCQLKFSKW